MSEQVATKKVFDFWLCAAVGLYVFNIVGWGVFLIWKAIHG